MAFAKSSVKRRDDADGVSGTINRESALLYLFGESYIQHPIKGLWPLSANRLICQIHGAWHEKQAIEPFYSPY
jgi:hypothetical protein